MDEQEAHRIVASGDAETVNRESARRTRRSFLVGGVAAAAGYGAWKLVESGAVIGRQPVALRRTFQADAAVARAVFGERGLAPEYPLSRARPLRLNGTVGMDQTLDLASWRLQLVGSAVAQGSPRYVPDVTAWEYRYTGDMQPDKQALDVKSAPGNTLGNPDPGDTKDAYAKDGDANIGDANSRDGGQQPATAHGSAKPAAGKDASQGAGKTPGRGVGGNAPAAQKSSPGGKAGQASQKKTAENMPEPGAGAGSGQPVTDAATARAHAQAAPPTDLAARFNRMAQAITHKRHSGDAEAGPSASSLDIGTPGLLLSMADLRQLPRVEAVFEFHCIEGWSEICQWAGVRLRDLIDAFPPARVNGREPRYVYMETPDGNYYGGYDLSAARHPQSMLVTEMGGQPLTQEHGAPLRLFMPVKYGYKNLKRIGLIAYTDTRPDDYWARLGYDWYAGL